ncbi:hypothetical protein Tco_0144668 [Tanacetum coccineum]
MTTLQFADTHNLVAFLTKSTESEGFEQIVDFLNASSIRYVLTVNPTIYTSCIEQFWSTVKAKTVNGEVQLQALVDGKNIVVTEASVRRDLQLEDADVEEANIAWDAIQAKVEADYQLAQRLQDREQEELFDAEKATLFVKLLEKSRKHFAAKRAEEKRNRPPTKAQQRSFISKKAETEIAQESSSKRAGEALEQESSKKQKVDVDKETEELKLCMEIISDDGDDVTIEAIPLSTKSPTIVDYKIYKEGKKSNF